MPGLYTGASGLWGGFAGLLYGSTSLSTPPGLLADAAWSPAQLFTQGESGGWYDPSDLTTLFQDAAGTTPVTAVEQPVGLVLDKSKGLVLGSELVSNGGFDSDTAWLKYGSPAPVISGGVATWSGTTSSYSLAQNMGLQSNKTYLVSFTVTSYTAGSISVKINGGGANSQSPSVSSTGTFTYRLMSPTADGFLAFAVVSLFSGSIDNISVRELPGSHLSQSTSTARPVLSARVNLLTRTEEFDNAAWTKTNVTVSQIAGAVWEVNEGTATGNHLVSQVLSQGTTAFGVAIDVRAGNASPWVRLTSRSSFVTNYLDFNLADQQQINENGTTTAFTNPTWSVTPLSDGWYRLQIRCDGVVNEAGARPLALAILDSSRNLSHTGTSRTIQIRYPQIETGNKNSSYQRVGAATSGTSSAAGNADYDSGPEWPRFLKFDGTDDFLVSGTISPGSVDKAQVFAGVRKLSDATRGILAEFSATRVSNDGTFTMDAPGDIAGTNARYVFASKGTVDAFTATTSTTFNAPITNVLTGIGDIAGDVVRLRVNGSQVSEVLTNQGTGNYGSYPVYVGRRGGTTLPANIQLYSLILRFSATNLDAATIAATETWVNNRTKAY